MTSRRELLFFIRYTAVVFASALVVSSHADSFCASNPSYDCNNIPSCAQIVVGSGVTTLADSRPLNQFFVIGVTGGTSTQRYNDSRRGRLATMRVGGWVAPGSGTTCVSGSAVVPPYDEDAYYVLDAGSSCFWVSGTLAAGNTFATFTGRGADTSGFYSYACPPTVGTKFPLRGVPVSASCKNAYLGTYTGSARAHAVCFQPASSSTPVTWRYREPGWEELLMPYSINSEHANTFCRDVGGFLGTPRNNTHATNILGILGDDVWTGAVCSEASAGTCVFDDGATSSVTIATNQISGRRLRLGRDGSGNLRLLQGRYSGVAAAWLDGGFLCSRPIQSISVAVASGSKCYKSLLQCPLIVTSSRRIEWYHLSSDTSTLNFRLELQDASTPVTVFFASQTISVATSMIGSTIVGAKTVTISMVSPIGFNFPLVQTATITVSDYERVTIVPPPSTTCFVQQSVTFAATKPTTDVITLTSSTASVTPQSFVGSTATLVAQFTAPTSATVVTFSASGQPFYFSATSPATLTFTVLAQSTVAFSNNAGSVLVEGDSFLVTATVSSVVSTVANTPFAVTPVLSVGAPLSASGGPLQWAVGAGPTGRTITYTCTAPPGGDPVAASVTFSYAHVQFASVTPAPSMSFTVHAKATVALAANAQYPAGVSNAIVVSATRVFVAGVTFALTCPGATISPTQHTPPASSTPVSLTFTVSATQACDMGVQIGGTTPAQWYVMPTARHVVFSASNLLTAAVNATTLYALQGGKLTIAASPSIPTGSITVVASSFSGVLFVGASSVTLSSGALSRTIEFAARSVSSIVAGSFTFSVSSSGLQSSFPTVILAVDVEIHPLESVTQLRSVAAVQSVGAAYGQVFEFQLPSLPEGARTAVGTLRYNSSAFIATPSAVFSWTGGDSYANKVITLIAIDVVASSPVNVTFHDSTSAKLNRTLLPIGVISTYRRADVWLTVVPTISYGTLPIVITVATNRAPNSSPLNVSLNLPSDFSPQSTAIASVPVNATSVNVTVTPTTSSSSAQSISASILVAFLNNNSQELDQYEGAIPAQQVTVHPFRAANLTCNDTRLYVTLGSSLLCAVNVSVATGGLLGFPALSPQLAFSATQLTFSSIQLTSTFLVSASLVAPPLAGGKATVALRASFSDQTYVQLALDILLKSVIAIEVEVPQLIYVGAANSFTLSFSLASGSELDRPSEAATVHIVSSNGLTYSAASVSFSPTQTAPVTVTCSGATPETVTFVFPVSGSIAFAPQTVQVTRHLLPLLRLSPLLVSPAGYLFVGQQALLSLSLTDALTVGTVTVAVWYSCGPTQSETSFVTAPNAIFAQSATVPITAVGSCTDSGSLYVTLTTTSSLVDTTALPSPIPFLVFPTTKPSLAVSSTVLYCGGVHSVTITMTLSRAPNASFYSAQLGVSPAPSALALSAASFNFTQGTPLLSMTSIVTAPVCPSVASVSAISVSLQDSPANSEFNSTAVTTIPMSVEVRPLLTASISALSSTVVFVQASASFTVLLPQRPEGGPLTATLTTNASLSVTIQPSSIEFTDASPLSVLVHVFGVSPGWAAVSVSFAGTASQYVPQPGFTQTLRVAARGVVSVTPSSVPSRDYVGRSVPVVLTTSMLPSVGSSVTVAVTSSNSTAAYATPSSITWSAESLAVQTFSVVFAATSIAPVLFRLTLTAPLASFTQQMNVEEFLVDVVNSRSILWTVPSVLYVGSINSASTAVTIAALPPAGQTLALSASLSGSQASALGINTIDPFTSASSTTQLVTLQGFSALDNIVLSLVVTSGGALYDAPPPVTVSVRALEEVRIAGLPSRMYVGATSVFAVTVTRLPEYCGTGALAVAVSPRSNLQSSANLSVSTLQFTSSDLDSVRQVSVTAVAATLAAHPAMLSFAVSGPCASIYSPPPAVAVSVFNLETATVSFPSGNLDSGEYFVYAGSSLLLTIDIGTPQIERSESTVFEVRFNGPAGAIAMNATEVTLPPTLSRATTVVSGLQPTGSASSIVVSVKSGGSFIGSINSVLLRIVPRIPLSIVFAQQPLQFFVVGVPTRVTVFITSTSLVGDVSVALAHGSSPQLTVAPAYVAARSATTSFSITVNASEINSGDVLTLLLTGAGAGSYAPSQTLWPSIRVVPRRSVQISFAVSMFVGSANRQSVALQLEATPDLDGDRVTVTLSGTQRLSWSASTVELTAAQPTASVHLTGLLPGTLDLASVIAVTSTSGQFNSRITAPQPGGAVIEVLAQRHLILSNYVPAMFTGDGQTFTVSLPAAPLSDLTITPSVAGLPDGASVSFAPALWVVPSGSTSLSASLVISVSGTFSATLQLTTSGSSEFLQLAASASLVVRAATDIVVFDLRSVCYVGTANAFTFGVAIRAAPPGGGTLTIAVGGSSSALLFTPTVLTFDSTSALTQYVEVVGRSPATNSPVSFAVEDTSGFFSPLAASAITVLPLERFAGTLTTSIVYVGLTASVTLTLTDGPRTALTLNLLLQQPRIDNQNAYTPLTSDQFQVSPAASVVLIGNLSVTFVITALSAGPTPRATFTMLRSAESVRYDGSTLPAFDMRFLARRSVSLSAPTVLYVGLESTANVSLSATPDASTFLVVRGSPTGGGSESLMMRNATQTFISMDLFKLFYCTPSLVGEYQVTFSVDPSPGNVAYATATTPSMWRFSVRLPDVVTLTGLLNDVYVGAANSVTLTISGYGTMSHGETLHVNLTCNSSSAVVFPPQVEVSSMSPTFSISSTSVQTVSCYVSVASSINRFVVDPAYVVGGTGLIVTFQALKTSLLAAPSKPSPYVNEPVLVPVTLARLPSPGRTLVATLGYTGSSANVVLSPPVSWTSQSTALTQSLSITGLSPTGANNVFVTLSGDSQYAELTTQRSISFLAYVFIDINPPLQGFVNQISPITFRLGQALVVVLTLTFSNPSMMRVVDVNGAAVSGSSVQWVFQDSVQKTAYLQCLNTGDVGVAYTVSGQDAAAFTAPLPTTVSCVAAQTVLVNAPSLAMVLYLSRTFSSRVTVSVLFRPTSGTLVVTPTVVCTTASSSIVTMSPSVLYFNSSYGLSQGIDAFPEAVGGPCDLTFPLSGNTTGYVGNRKFTIRVAPLINISLSSAVPREIYVGSRNRIPITFSLDSSATIPLSSPVQVTLSTSAQGSLCIDVSPTTVYWAASSDTEVLSKTVYVTALCSTSDPQFILTSVAFSSIYQNRIPSTIQLAALPLINVQLRSSQGEASFFLYVGGNSLDFTATLGGGNLSETESLTVTAVYQGVTGSTSQVEANWLPSPVFLPSKTLVIFPMSVSPAAALSFSVVGPPRFSSRALLATQATTGTLQVIGSVPVRAAVPSTMLVGSQYSTTVSLGGSLRIGEVVTVTPLWYGSGGSLTWSPQSLVFTTDDGLQKNFVFTANTFQAGFRLVLVVSGSTRFAVTAFDATIVIQDAIQIISTSLPAQLMRGQRYALGIDIRQLPPLGSMVSVSTAAISGPECITFPSGSRFFFNTSNPNDVTVQTVVVEVVKIDCPVNQLPFVVAAASSAMYSRFIPSRRFSTVRPAAVSVDWPQFAYVGDGNAVTGVLLLVAALTDVTSVLNISIAFSPSSGLALSTDFVSFTYGGASSLDVQLKRQTAGVVEFGFFLSASDASVDLSNVPNQTIEFLPLINISIVQSPTNGRLYTGKDNMQGIYFRLSAPIRSVDNRQAREILLTATSSSGNLTIQPTYVKWSVGYNVTQFLYVEGVAPEANVVVRFQLSGSGASYVATFPTSISLHLATPLLITHTVPPEILYVGPTNAMRINLTLPNFTDTSVSRVTVGLSILGDASSVLVTPSSVSWMRFTNSRGVEEQNFTTSAVFNITGLFPTNVANVLQLTKTFGPPWIAVAPNPLPLRGTIVQNLRTITFNPPLTTLSIYVAQTRVISYAPASATVRCDSEPNYISAVTAPGNLTLTTLQVVSITPVQCRVFNDTSFTSPAPFRVTVLQRKRLFFAPSILFTYVGVTATFSVTAGQLPSTILVVTPVWNFSTNDFSISPPAITFGPTSTSSLGWSFTGVRVSNASLGPVPVPLSFSGPLSEYDVALPSTVLGVQVLEFLSVSIVSTTSLQPPLMGNTTVANASMFWKGRQVSASPLTIVNVLEIRFSIPRATVFHAIRIAPNLDYDPSGALRFCSSPSGCLQSDLTTTNPLVLDQSTTTVRAYIYSTAVTVLPIYFTVINAVECVDFRGDPSLYVGTVSFRDYEQVVVDASRFNGVLYVGANNSQILRVTPTGLQFGSSAVEAFMTVPSSVTAEFLPTGESRFQVTSSPASTGGTRYVLSWTNTMNPVAVRLVGVSPTPFKVQIVFAWRSTPPNFSPTFNMPSVGVTVVPQIAFTVQVPLSSGAVMTLAQGVTESMSIYMGSQNRFQLTIATPTFPVVAGTVMVVDVVASTAGVLTFSQTTVVIGEQNNAGAKAVTVSIFAPVRVGASSNAALVTFKLRDAVSPPEFLRTEYRLELTVQPLQTLRSTLSSFVLAVGAENAVSFTLAPRQAAFLTLGAQVSCTDISFTPVDTLAWANTTEPRTLRISATTATGLGSTRCVIMTPVTGGGDRNTFESPPFNATIVSIGRPQVRLGAPLPSAPPPGASVAANGFNVTLALPGSYFKWKSGVTLATLLSSGAISITSTRSPNEEPASVMALLGRQTASSTAAVFVTLFHDTASNTITLQFGPSADFQPTTLETVTVSVNRNAVEQGASFDPSFTSVSFSIQGAKKELFASSSGFIGSGTSAASIIGAMVSMTAAQQANRLQTITGAFVCPNEDWRQKQGNFDWSDMPIPMSFGSDEDLGGYAAVAVSDVVVIMICMLLHLAFAWAQYERRLRGSFADKSFAAALAIVRFPSFLLIPVLFFYQTIVSSSFTTTMYSPRLHIRMIGAFSLIVFGFGIPVIAFTIIGPSFHLEYLTDEELRRRRAQKLYATNVRSIMSQTDRRKGQLQSRIDSSQDDSDDSTTESNLDQARSPHPVNAETEAPRPKSIEPSTGNALLLPAAAVHDDFDAACFDAAEPSKRSGFAKFMQLFKPPGRWFSEDDPQWIQRFELFFGEYRGGRHWYIAIDLGLTFLLGIIDGIQPVDVPQCLGRTSAYVTLFLIQFVCMVVLRPYNTFNNIFFIVSYFLQFLSMTFVAVAVFRNDLTWGGVQVAVNALVLFGTFLYAKTVLDFIVTINDQFELEKFFEEKEEVTLKVLQGPKAEAAIERNFVREMTHKLVQKQKDKQREQIGFLLRGPPQHDGRTLAEIEEEQLEHETEPYDPRRLLARYRGPDGGDADPEEEAVLEQHEREAATRRVRVALLEPRAVAPHYFDPEVGRVKFRKRLDDRFERLLAARQKELQPQAHTKDDDVRYGASPRAASDRLERDEDVDDFL